jgi:hypothetical protein
MLGGLSSPVLSMRRRERHTRRRLSLSIKEMKELLVQHFGNRLTSKGTLRSREHVAYVMLKGAPVA